MKKIILSFIFIVLAVLAGWFSAAGFNNFNEKSRPEVCIAENCYKVELAVTVPEQEKGLMFRKNLDKGKGMLFKFPQKGIYPFWMKNTLIPLDIVWIGSDNKIVFISRDTRPCVSDPCHTTNPGETAHYVLEVNSGEMDRIGAKVGDVVVINH